MPAGAAPAMGIVGSKPPTRGGTGAPSTAKPATSRSGTGRASVRSYTGQNSQSRVKPSRSFAPHVPPMRGPIVPRCLDMSTSKPLHTQLLTYIWREWGIFNACRPSLYSYEASHCGGKALLLLPLRGPPIPPLEHLRSPHFITRHPLYQIIADIVLRFNLYVSCVPTNNACLPALPPLPLPLSSPTPPLASLVRPPTPPRPPTRTLSPPSRPRSS